MALTKTTNVIKDGLNNSTTIVTANDGTNHMSAVGVLGADGSLFLPAGASDATAIFFQLSGGTLAHDAAAGSAKPALVGGFAKSTAPADVSADGDAVQAWFLRNGAQVHTLAVAGNLMPGGSGVVTAGTQRVVLATDVALPAGTNTIGGVNIVAPIRGTWTNRSLAITTGGTAQSLMSSNAARVRMFVLNPPTETLSIWINFTTTAVADSPSIELPPGASWDDGAAVSTEAVSVIAATTGHKVVAKEM